MKKAVFFTLIILSLIIIKNLITSIYELWTKQDLVVSTQKELEEEQKKNKFLKDQLQFVQSPVFIEEQARNKLFLVQPGETEIILEKPPVASSVPSNDSKTQLPVWKQWLALFF